VGRTLSYSVSWMYKLAARMVWAHYMVWLDMHSVHKTKQCLDILLIDQSQQLLRRNVPLQTEENISFCQYIPDKQGVSNSYHDMDFEHVE